MYVQMAKQADSPGIFGRARRFFFGPTESERIKEKYRFPVEGESKFQDALANICGAPNESGHCVECQAELVPTYDQTAVEVRIQTHLVGFLQKSSAKKYIKKFGHGSLQTSAIIRGGWVRSNDRTGLFGVSLDFEL